MSQLDGIQSAQRSLEECFSRRMADLEAQIQSAGPAKDTVAKVAEEFRTFRELVFTMLGLLRKQIEECCHTIDDMETRHRRKDLIFLGITESENEDCTAKVLDIIQTKMAIKDVSVNSITNCHRLGASNKEHHRPILVRFARGDLKASIWRSKKGLKGSNVSVKEFLTKARQSLFVKARQHFGMRSCWTRDGVILIKVADGSRARVTSASELDLVLRKYPKATGTTSLAVSDGAGNVKSVPRKN